MLEKSGNKRNQIEIICTEEMMPDNHLLRQIESAVDFNNIYDFVADLYSADNGRPSIDPVVLFKMVMIQHLYGIPSLRRTAEEVKVNVAYRWFLGYGLTEATPHFSTLSYNFKHRFTTETVDKIFSWILDEVADAGYLRPEAVFIDGTHIKANANTKKQVKEEVSVAAKRYADELMKEINESREAHGKKPLANDNKDKEDDENTPKPAAKKKKDNTSKKKLKRRKKKQKRKRSSRAPQTLKADCL